MSTTSRPRCGPTRSPANRCCGTGSVIAAAIEAAPSSATGARPRPSTGSSRYTDDLIDLLNVLGRLIALEPRQAGLLSRICAARLLSPDDLREAGALPSAEEDETAAAVSGGG